MLNLNFFNQEDIKKVNKSLHIKNEGKNIEYEKVLKYAEISHGDLRKALNILELGILASSDDKIVLDGKYIESLGQESLKFGQSDYYDWVSMFQKRIRGSCPDAAVLSLGVLLKAGKLEDVCRRLLVIASEDIGMAMGNSYGTIYGLVSAAKMVGMPEARIILSHATIYLATLLNQIAACLAIDKAMKDIDTKDIEKYQSILEMPIMRELKN